MAAESGGGGLMNVLGEYGVFLVEMGSLQDIYGPAKTMSRIKLTCISTGRKYIAVGTTSGGLYIYNRKTLDYVRLITTKDGPIAKVCFAFEKSYLGVATSNGILTVIDVGSRTRDKPKCLRRSEEHKSTIITSLCWDDNDSRLFAGDEHGFVSATYLPTKFGSSMGQSKKSLIGHKSTIVGKSETPINQLDYAAQKLLISTMTKTAVLDLATSQCWLVGSKPREGAFGACFLKQMNQESATIYTARPGSRLWEAGMDGQVISTQHYKQLLAVPPSPVLGYGHDVVTSQSKDEGKPKSFNFAKLLLIRERFLLTWLGSTVFLLDPVLGQLAGWYQLGEEISDVCCHGNQFYIYYGDSGHMTWYGVLTVKETVARLFEINDYKQCIKVTLECKSYLIPGTARDWVPVSMVMLLIKSIQDQPDSQELVESLQELKQLLQENTNISTDKPPGFYGDGNMIDSPETMSINSDICSHHMDSGLEDDDNLSINQGDTNGEHASGLRKKKEDFSLENALFSVAAKAKKFAEERQKSKNFKLPIFRKLLTETETRETKADENMMQELAGNDDEFGRVMTETKEGPSTEELVGNANLSTSEMSPSVPRRTNSLGAPSSDVVIDLSDDNESKLDEDSLDTNARKGKEKSRDKKKKKRRVVTVDINTPPNKVKEGNSLKVKEIKVRADSYSSFEDTKVKLRRSQSERGSPTPFVLSPIINDVPSELPPAIPAMLSKAKVLIKKKLTPLETGTDNPFDLRSSQSFSVQNEGEETEDEEEEDLVELPRPVKVEELEKVTIRVRDEVQTPKILYSRMALRHVLKKWIPVLYAALNSCKESLSSSQNPAACLMNWLGESSYSDVCMLTKMCLDTGVYGQSDNIERDKDQRARDENECSRNNTGLEQVDKREAVQISRDEKEFSRDRDILEISRDDSECSRDNTGLEQVVKREAVESSRDEKECSRDSSKLESYDLGKTASDVKTRDKDCSRDESMKNAKEGPRDHVKQIINERDKARLLLNYENKAKTDDKQSDEEQTDLSCEFCSHHHHSILDHVLTDSLSQASRAAFTEKERDSARASFIRKYYGLLRVRDIRRTLGVTSGYKHTSWCVLLDCIKESSKQDVVSDHIKNGHVTRALHVLHDGILEYQDTILLHLVNLYELSGRETLMTCVRMYPDVLPWEVMEICRQGMSRDPNTSAQYFVYYVEQLMRWRVDLRERRIRTFNTLCDDREFMRRWFHNSLIADSSDGQRHCPCGLPRSGSHRLPWKHEEHLQQMLNIVCHRHSFSEMAVFLDMCWKHGYWLGVLRLCAAKKHRYLIIQVIVCLGDISLLDSDKSWGPTPQCLDEWRTLLELVVEKTSTNQQSYKSDNACAVDKESDWLPDINWDNVVHLGLKRLGASRLVALLQDVPNKGMSLPVDFYHKCIMGIVIEKEQTKLIHQMLIKLDSYFWSKRAGALTPEMNYQRIQEQESGQTSKSQEESTSSVNCMSRVKTLEDAATNWGVNIKLVDAVCPVCTLHVSEQVSSSNQGLLVFECGHVFHKFCVPEQACVVCFHQNLKTLSKARMSSEEKTVHLI